MALEKVSNILNMADRANTSAIAFNCTDYGMIQAVVKVAEELNKPVIVMLNPLHAHEKHWTTPAVFAYTVKTEAEKGKVPIGLHLDHCTDYDYIIAAIKAGFQSVMYDGSMLPVEDNIVNTRMVVEAAHVMGADVEAELGWIGFASNVTDQQDEDLYTKADVAASFCEQSGCDSLAVAIGTAHGFYKEAPNLDMKRLEAINAATQVPLVLHGGTGVPEDQVAMAFRKGINKFNVGTEFFYLYYQTIKEYCNAGHPDIYDMPLLIRDRLENYLRSKMRISKLQYH